MSRAVISGWLAVLSDFQGIHRFGSKITERFVDLRKNAHFSIDVFSVSCFGSFVGVLTRMINWGGLGQVLLVPASFAFQFKAED